MGATLTTVLPLYSEHLAKNISKLWYSTEGLSPIMASAELKANTGEGAGRNFIQRVQYSVPAVATATFATSQAKSQGSTTGSTFGSARFEIPAVELHAFANFTRQAIQAAEGNPDETFKVVDTAIKMAMTDVKNQLSYQVCERGWGRVGTITAVTSSTITIDTSLCNRLVIGDDLLGALAESTGAVLSATTCTVTGINSDTGVVSLGSDPTALSWAIGTVVFRNGNRDQGGSPVKLCISGMRAWLDHTSASTTLFNVDRTGNERLLGYKVDATNLSIADALQKAAAKLTKNGASDTTTVYLSVDDFTALSMDKDVQKNIPIKMRDDYEIGFVGIAVLGPNGKPIKVLSDINLENGVGYMGPFDGAAEDRPFFFHDGSDVVSIDDIDGNMFLRSSTAASYEARMNFRGNFVLPAPAKYCAIYNIGVTS